MRGVCFFLRDTITGETGGLFTTRALRFIGRKNWFSKGTPSILPKVLVINGTKGSGEIRKHSTGSKSKIELCQTTLGAKSNKRCDRLNIFKTITVQKNPIVLTGCKRFSDIKFLSSQISTFGMVIVCTGTYHRLRSVEIYVGLSFQCRPKIMITVPSAHPPKTLRHVLLQVFPSLP